MMKSWGSCHICQRLKWVGERNQNCKLNKRARDAFECHEPYGFGERKVI